MRMQFSDVPVESTSEPRPGRSLLFLCCAATAGLLWLSYFPVDCGWLAWIALVPFLAMVQARVRTGQLLVYAWLTGLLFYWPALQWLRVADYRMYATWAALATYCSFFFPLTAW